MLFDLLKRYLLIIYFIKKELACLAFKKGFDMAIQKDQQMMPDNFKTHVAKFLKDNCECECDKVSVDDSKCRRVPTYHCAWWLAWKPRNLDSVDVMDRLRINRCLEVHRHLLLPSQRGEVITSGSTSTRLPAPTFQHRKPAVINVSATVTSSVASCVS